MARLNATGKVQRVVEFLLGLRDERVLAALVGCGFTHAERAKGWQLLQALGMTDIARDVRQDHAQLFPQLDAWHNQWVRIAKLSLQRDYPRVYDQIFMSIDKAPHATAIAVPIFLKLFEKLTRANDGESKAALAKLRRRGLSPERIAEGQELVAQLMKLDASTQPAPDMQERRAAIEQAEAALWNYYVEWSQLARAVIKDVRLLKVIGFRGGAGDNDEQETAAIGETPKPAAKGLTPFAAPVVNGRKSHKKQTRKPRVR